MTTARPSEGGTGSPTTGTGGLDVPLGVHLLALREADKDLQEERDKRYCERNRRQDDAIKHVEEMHETMRKSDSEAVEKAFASATKLSEAHNDLLRKMEKLTEQFATRENVTETISRSETRVDEKFEHVATEITVIQSWQSRFTGGLLVVAAIGVANLVKIWGG